MNLIIGAGITGLSTAAHMKDCCVIEQHAEIGGLARTVAHGGFRFDLGGHRFFSADPGMDRYFRALLADELVTVERRSKIYRNGRAIDYPLSTALVFQENPLILAHHLLAYIFRKIHARNPVRSFDDHVINNLGDAIYASYFRDYSRKVWGVPCEELSVTLAQQRIQDVSLSRAVWNVFTKRRFIKSFIDRFVYPRTGICRLCAALATGVDVRTNSRVTSLVHQNGLISSAVLASGEQVICQTLTSTIPLTELALMLDPPENVRAAIGKLKYRDLIVVFLAYRREQLTPWHWIYAPGSEIFGRIHEPKNWSAAMAPDGQTGVCLEICCERGDELWRMDDAQLIERCTRDLVFHDAATFMSGTVKRVTDAYPIFYRDYGANLRVVTDFLSGFTNLFVAGRTGAYRYLNMDDCLKEGIDAAERVRKWHEQRQR